MRPIFNKLSRIHSYLMAKKPGKDDHVTITRFRLAPFSYLRIRYMESGSFGLLLLLLGKKEAIASHQSPGQISTQLMLSQLYKWSGFIIIKSSNLCLLYNVATLRYL
jgi:hypothetical protein